MLYRMLCCLVAVVGMVVGQSHSQLLCWYMEDGSYRERQYFRRHQCNFDLDDQYNTSPYFRVKVDTNRFPDGYDRCYTHSCPQDTIYVNVYIHDIPLNFNKNYINIVTQTEMCGNPQRPCDLKFEDFHFFDDLRIREEPRINVYSRDLRGSTGTYDHSYDVYSIQSTWFYIGFNKPLTYFNLDEGQLIGTIVFTVPDRFISRFNDCVEVVHGFTGDMSFQIGNDGGIVQRGFFRDTYWGKWKGEGSLVTFHSNFFVRMKPYITHSRKPTDINLDGKVDFGDFMILSSEFGIFQIESICRKGIWRTELKGDFNNDCKVNFKDFLMFTKDFGKSCRN